MSLGRSVQYTSKEQVLSAYEDFEISSWSILNGKQFLWKYSGDDLAEGARLLERCLNDLLSSESIGIYTLCLYENATEVKPKTPYDSSFNFRFATESKSFVPGLGGPPAMILEEMRAMRKEIEELRERIEDDDGDHPPQNSGPLGTIGELLKNPEIMSLVRGLMSGNSAAANNPAQLSGVSVNDEEEKISRAIPILKVHDEKLGTHLIKLAELAEKSSVKFRTMISILDSM